MPKSLGLNISKKANINKIECLFKNLSFSSTRQMLQQEQHLKERFMEWCWCYVILTTGILEGSSGLYWLGISCFGLLSSQINTF